MGVGPNYVLDKGFLATGSTAYAFGECVTPTSAGTAVARATTADVTTPIFICQEDLDTTRLATAKAVIDCRILGIARVIAGGTVAVGDRVTNNTSARAVARSRTAAGSQLLPSFGIALTGGSSGQHIDVLLTPSGLF